MELQKKFATAILVQSIGPASLFFSVWLIAHTLGVEAQGKFAAVKSLVELLTACLLFGLPQSFVFGINQLKIQRNQLVRWVIGYGVAIALIMLFILLGAKKMQWMTFNFETNYSSDIYYLIAAISGCVILGLLRGIYLSITDGWRFSVMTIFPSIILSGIVIFAIANDNFNPLQIYALMGLLSAMFSIYLLRGYTSPTKYIPVPWGSLLKNGSSIFLQNIFLAAQPYLTFAVLRNNNVNYTDIAYFSLAMYVYQAGVMPLTMCAPILYNRWTKKYKDSKKEKEIVQILWGLIPVMTLLTVVWLFAPWLVLNTFGENYENAIPTIRIMIATVPLLYIVQVGAPVFMSMGLFGVNLQLVSARLITCMVSLIIMHNIFSGSSAINAAWSWFVAEAVAAIFTGYALKSVLGKYAKGK